MKYQIYINQLVLEKTKLDLTDAAILDYLIWYCGSQSPKIDEKRIAFNGKRYTWVNYDSILKDLPILRIKSKKALTPRIHRIAKEGFISTKIGKHSRMYICLTEKTDSVTRTDLAISKSHLNDRQESSTQLLEIGINKNDSKSHETTHAIYDTYTSDNITKDSVTSKVKKTDFKKTTKKTLLTKLKDLPISLEEKEDKVDEMQQVFNDAKSLPYLRLVAAKIPSQKIFDALHEIKGDKPNNPIANFIWKMERHAFTSTAGQGGISSAAS